MKLDFDFKDLNEWENFYKFFKAVFELSIVSKVVVKETYKGYHVYSDYVSSPEKEMALRYYFGDDQIRIMYDEERLRLSPHLNDVLYVHKMTGKVTGSKNGIKIIKNERYDEVELNNATNTV